MVAFVCVAILISAPAWMAFAPENILVGAPFTGPHLVISATRCNLGMVSANQSLVARFVLRNTGDGRLIVRRDNGACCGQQDDTIIVQPGDTTELVIEFESTGQLGPLEKSFSYATNDRASPRFQLVVSALIAEPLK